MALTLSARDQHVLASLDGELTIGVVDEMQDEFKALLNHKDVLIDVSGVTDIDSCGCQMLALLARYARERQRRLYVLSGNALVDTRLRQLGMDRQVLRHAEVHTWT